MTQTNTPMKLWAHITLDERSVSSVTSAARIAPGSVTVALETLLAGGHVVCGVMTVRGRQVPSVRRADDHGQPDITVDQWREAMLSQRAAPAGPIKRTMRWLKEWIEARARKDGDCMVWSQAVRKGSGTPMARIGGQTQPARRALWEALHGRHVPQGHRIMASCGNPQCVALSHLVAMTHSESCIALIEQGRFVQHTDPRTRAKARASTRSREASLSAAELEAVKIGLEAGRSGAEIARELGRNQTTVSRIKLGVRQGNLLPGASVFSWRPA